MELTTELPLELKTTNPSDISKPTSQSPRPNRRGFYGLDTKRLCSQSQKDYTTKESEGKSSPPYGWDLLA